MLNTLHALQSKIFSLSSPHTQPSVEIHVYLLFLCISGSFLSSSGMWFKESIWSLLPLCLHAFLLVTFFTQLPYPSQKWRVIWCVCSSLMCLLKKCNHMIIQKQISTFGLGWQDQVWKLHWWARNELFTEEFQTVDTVVYVHGLVMLEFVWLVTFISFRKSLQIWLKMQDLVMLLMKT